MNKRNIHLRLPSRAQQTELGRPVCSRRTPAARARDFTPSILPHQQLVLSHKIRGGALQQ